MTAVSPNSGLESIPERPTLRMVAQAAGVSPSTASRALSGAGGASAKAAAAVNRARNELGYRANPIARALRVRSTKTIGVVVPEIRNPFFADLIGAIERRAQTDGFDVLVSDSQNDVEHEAKRIATMLDRRVDGLLVIPNDDRTSADALIEAQKDIPIVQVDRRVGGRAGDSVGVDSGLGIMLILEHLRDLGCQELCFVSGDSSSSTGRARIEAFEYGVNRLGGFTVQEHLVGDFSIEYGTRAASELRQRNHLPDAVVCGSDLNAVGVMREFQAHGLTIPRDIRVTGFDGILLAELVAPALTTIRQPVQRIADEAVRLLISRMGEPSANFTNSLISPEIIARESTIGKQS